MPTKKQQKKQVAGAALAKRAPSARPGPGSLAAVKAALIRPPPSMKAGRPEAWARAVSGKARQFGQGNVAEYLHMLMNPWDRECAVQYPDDTIDPTSMVHLSGARPFTSGLAVDASGRLLSEFLQVVPCTTGSSPNAGTFQEVQGFGALNTILDYGAPQVAWNGLSAVNRTLAAGLRARISGLPTNTFSPQGRCYWIQYEQAEYEQALYSATTGTLTETSCRQAVEARKGFSITAAELAEIKGGVGIFALPRGPGSFAFAVNDALAPQAGTDPTTSVPLVVAGGVVLGFHIFGVTGAAAPNLLFDFAHHIEYVPEFSAAGLVHTEVKMPNVLDRQNISGASSVLMQRVYGGTSSTDIVPYMGGAGQDGYGPIQLIASTLAHIAEAADPRVAAVAGLAKGAQAAFGKQMPGWLNTMIQML